MNDWLVLRSDEARMLRRLKDGRFTVEQSDPDYRVLGSLERQGLARCVQATTIAKEIWSECEECGHYGPRQERVPATIVAITPAGRDAIEF